MQNNKVFVFQIREEKSQRDFVNQPRVGRALVAPKSDEGGSGLPWVNEPKKSKPQRGFINCAARGYNPFRVEFILDANPR